MTPIQDRVATAIEKLKQDCTLDDVNRFLQRGFQGNFTVAGYAPNDQAVATYVGAVSGAFYTHSGQLLTTQYRECALVALLASQGAERNLAIHLFIALLAGVSVDDVVDLLFLSGVYSGANLLTQSMRVATKTFDAIAQAADDGVVGCEAIFRAIGSRFPDALYEAAVSRLTR